MGLNREPLKNKDPDSDGDPVSSSPAWRWAQLLKLLPCVVTGDVVEEGLGLVVVAVGAERVALLVGVALAVLSFHTRVSFVLSVQRLLRLLIYVTNAHIQTNSLI